MTTSATDESLGRTKPPQRGSLIIRERAARRAVEGIIEHWAPDMTAPTVSITSLSDDGIEIDATVRLQYPTDPLSGVLADLRRHIAREAARQLGRPTRRVDLTVADFVTSRPVPPRRVL